MLANLHIENFALIEQLDIDFPSGFAIITGETGAGKSIMLGALSLLMGTRADMQARRNPERRMVAEAVFRVQRTDRLSALLSDVQDDTDVQDDEKTIEIILRREISPTDRSRAFVNDSPVNLKQLTAIASQLVDIHTQHSNLLMERPEFQLGILDAIADDSTLLNTYKRVFNRYAILRHSIKQKREVLNRNREQEEYITFRLEQLRKLKPRAGEQAELERRLEILSAAEEIRSSLGNLCRLLDGNESAALPSLHDARLQLAEVNPAALPPQEEEEGGRPCCNDFTKQR